MNICPCCGRLRPEMTDFRKQLLELADGTRTKQELARLTGKQETVVATTLVLLRQSGYLVYAKFTNAAAERNMLKRWHRQAAERAEALK